MEFKIFQESHLKRKKKQVKLMLIIHFSNPVYPNPLYGINAKIINEILMIFSKCISSGCSNKIPQMGWLKIRQLYSLAIWRLEIQNQGFSAPSGTLGSLLPCFFPVWWWPAMLGIPWLAATSLQSLPPSSQGVLLPGCALLAS